jgi:putative oxidoreductase
VNKLFFDQAAFWSDSIAFLRVWCGVIFIRYGLTLFTPASMADFASTLQPLPIPFPGVAAYLCKTTEFIGGILLVIGFLRRPAALLIAIDMTVATFVFHKGLLLRNGMTTFTLLLCCLTIFLLGPDRFSLDRAVASQLEKKRSVPKNQGA